ncbi:uncharacterized protein LOC130762429 [Actinidia eriantha]|uniref:uncharacterized protein LOC130762429 n=1 Tax=Actinidia eriantha TaxID=165200 RepID=UPI0025836E0A|nr:uncharacterized protein LOC130762429 [Actinidia eriantha]
MGLIRGLDFDGLVHFSPNKTGSRFTKSYGPDHGGVYQPNRYVGLNIMESYARLNSKANQKTTSSEQQDIVLEKRKSSTKQSGAINRAPGLSFGTDGKSSNIAMDLQFEERLKAVKRSALEQKKSGESEKYGAIDYDAPVESDPSTIGLGTKIGIGAAIVVFGLVFALGDFLPTGSERPTKEVAVINSKLSEEEKKNLQTRLQQYEATLAASPEDANALEGTAVTLTELGEYPRAASLLEDLTKKKPNDPDAFRLLGEVKYELRDYEGSVAAYRRSAMVSKTVKFEILRGLTNSLLAAKKPDEAVQVLLVSRETLKTENSNNRSISTDGSTLESESQEVDPIQVELLLGKAYSDWGRVTDAVSVYDQLISRHPNDFRGYLAKILGIILKENGRVGEAERMFIQARFFAPVKAKALVDRYSRQ